MSHAAVRDLELAGMPADPDSELDAPHLVTELPGPGARAHIEFDERYTSPSLPRAYPIVPVRGRGSVIEDIDGNRFLDFCAGIAVNVTGHCHPRVVAAIQEQAAELLHYSASDFYLPIYAHLAAQLERIAPMTGPTRVFLGNSGTEVVEAAIKLARYATGRQYIVGFLGGFHGRTYGSVSLTASKAKYHAHFGPLLPGVYHVPVRVGRPRRAGAARLPPPGARRTRWPRSSSSRSRAKAGSWSRTPEFLPRLRRICDQHGILLVADEVQSGMGRTGRMWAIQHWGVEPDIVLTAKGLASGMPIGALIAREHLMTWSAGAHGSTFGGNPVSCAAALATIALLEEGLIDNATARGEQMLAALRPLVAALPGPSSATSAARASWSASSSTPAPRAAAVEHAAFERGLMVLTAGDDVIRMSPPLVVTEARRSLTGCRVFAEAVAAVAGR